MSEQTTVTDTSADKKYFILTPQIVWALARDTYDYTLWDTVKMIAGDHGECILSTEDLALLAMMSVGKVVDCRAYLLDQRLLLGELKRDPGYPQPVWHLRVPDLWQRNIEWRASFHSLEARIELKRQWKELKKSLHLVKANQGPSPGEEGPSPGEGYPSPGEAKKNHKEEPKEEPTPDFSKIWELDPLITYQINPFTLCYFGSSHNFNKFDDYSEVGMTEVSRQLFFKLQYLFQT